VVTSDHGMPPDPPAGRQRYYLDDLTAQIHQRFDPSGQAVVQYYNDAANSQMYIDTGRLQSLGFTLGDVARFLEAHDAFAAAFTEDEVRAAQSRLPALP
jgi:hypothetical protein